MSHQALKLQSIVDHQSNPHSKCLGMTTHDHHTMLGQTCTMVNVRHTILKALDQACSTQPLMLRLRKWHPGKAELRQHHNKQRNARQLVDDSPSSRQVATSSLLCRYSAATSLRPARAYCLYLIFLTASLDVNEIIDTPKLRLKRPNTIHFELVERRAVLGAEHCCLGFWVWDLYILHFCVPRRWGWEALFVNALR